MPNKPNRISFRRPANNLTEVEASIDAAIQQEGEEKARMQKAKQRQIQTGLKLMDTIRKLEADFRKVKATVNLECQAGSYVRAELLIERMTAALKDLNQ